MKPGNLGNVKLTRWCVLEEQTNLFLGYEGKKGKSLSETSRQISVNRGSDFKSNVLCIRLRNQYLRGRLRWGSDNKGNFAEMADQPTFGAIISAVEVDLIMARLPVTSLIHGVRNRKRRIFTD
ncbi:hypothetical protein N9T35_00545 [bacterium]|nr:hypothetical protein [bacterium]